MRAHHTLSRHRPRKRAIQYSEASMMESIGRSVLDTPLSRSMTIFARKRRRFHLSFCGGGYGLLRGACHRARVRATERHAGYIDLSNSIQPPKRPILIKAEHRIRREPERMGFVTGTATAQAYEPRYIRLDPNDNVAIVVNDLGLPAKTRFPCGLELRNFVPQGHKVALSDILEGAPIR